MRKNRGVELPAQNTRNTAPPGRVLFALSLVPLIMVLGNSMLIPVLPAIANEYDLSALESGLLITLFSVPAGMIIPLAGLLSDRIGRKKIILTALALYGTGGLIAGGSALFFAEPYPWIIAGRIIQGIGAAGTAPIAMALIGDLYPPEHRGQAFGIIESANGLGKVLSPILGSLLALIAWYMIFFAFPFMIAPVLWAIARWVDEKKPEAQPSPAQYKQDILRIFQKQGRWLTLSFLLGAGHMFFLFGALFFLAEMLDTRTTFSGIVRGLYLALPLLSLTLVSAWAGNAIERHPSTIKMFLILGTCLLGSVCLLLPFIGQPFVVIALLFVSGIGSGLVLPSLNILITSAVGKAERGIVTSLYSSVRFLGIAAGPAAFGALPSHPLLLFWGTGGACFLLALFAARLLRRPRKIQSKRGHSRLILHTLPQASEDPA
ncbi:MFS transporter [Aneurinibacillus thermoaerophilus]|uniref:MFS transporter n=1 Tax=Aneurinibacillus thermoaerophilus TaxID=143495 RepID=A0ABX8Y7V2_ANETH|nr:MFS transporter [Aneurinibacillus thermoaerophilus]MED0735510.1 MFS transporter [Aneurinibacillus thermoaerophilus]QYY41748.1 MFS transporter [Aneurinibacillus thermoaerophilus]